MQKLIKILLLEDEPIYTDVLTMGLEQEGFEAEIVEVATKKGFVDQLKKSSFDVIISDYTLPDINGMEAVQIAVALVPDTPVVVFTGSVGEETAIACLKAGAVDYVLKQNPARLVPSLLKAVDAAAARKEQENAERALKESEERYRTLINTMNEGLLQVSNDDVIQFVNERFCEMLGYKPQELIGKVALEVFVDEDARKLILEKNQLRERGIADQYEIQMKTKSGERIWVHVSGAPVYDRGGNVIGSVGIHADITERKLAENALHESEKKYRELVDNLGEVIYEINSDGEITFINQAIRGVSGYKPQRIVGKNLTDLIYQGDRDLLLKRLEELKHGKEHISEYRIVSKSGEVRWIETSSKPTMEGNKYRGARGTLVDITDRKRVEKALHESEERFRNLVENITDVFYILDPEGKLIYGSPNLFSESGYAPHEIIGKSYLRLVAPVDRQRVVDYYEAQTRLGVLDAACEFRAFRKDGAILWTEQRTRIVRDGAGKVIEYRNVVRNVTERKLAEETSRRAEEARQESEKKYRELVENLSDVIYEINPRAEITFVNLAIRRVLGYEPEELVGKSVFDLIYPADRDVLLKRLGELKQGIEFPLEYRIMTKSGDVRWIRTWSKPIKEGNIFLGARGTLVDITDRKRADEALQKSETRFRTLFELAGIGVAVIETGTGRFAEINQKYCDILGYTKEEMLWTTFQAVTYPDDLQVDLDNMELLRQGAIRTFSMEKRYLHKNGRIVWVNLTVSPLWKTGRPIDFHVAVVEDITASKQAHEIARNYAERLQALSKQLLEIQENERSMIARELHDEIGQSLTRLKILLEMDKRGKAGAAGENLREAAELAGSLISRVRDLSLDLRPPMLDDLGLVPAIRSHFLHHTEKMGIETHFIAEPEEMHFSREIEVTCFRVAQEAVTNALRHSRAKSIAVQLKRCETSLELSVRDDGAGFDVETAFRQSAEGKSFGLLGMQERVRLAGGIFAINSDRGGGSEVHAKFPDVFAESLEGSERHAGK